MVVGRVGVEIGAARFDDDFAKQPRIGELMKGVVDRRERHLDRRSRRFACNCSAVIWRSPFSSRIRAKARRWRVGRRPAARRRSKAVNEGDVIIMQQI